MEATLRSDFSVSKVQSMGSDETIARAARASTGNDLIDLKKIHGLIGYLMREGHTSPFEHCVLTVRVEVPLFVAREWERHRTQSYSELSMRFAVAKPNFYKPNQDRPLVNAGSGAHPDLVQGSDEQFDVLAEVVEHTYGEAWLGYCKMLDNGIAEELARIVLPVGTYTTFWATANLNNWFKFLHLRNGDTGAPQWEIVQVAQQVEAIIAEQYPIAYAAWKSTYADE